ncbi:MAG: cation:proton antiporter [Acidimicrobiia bacterium]
MEAEAVVLVGAAVVLVVTLVSGKLEDVWLTEPMVALILGLIGGIAVFGPVDLESPLILTLLELTLALVLFSDASRIEIARLREGFDWPLRMLLVGMPVVIALGAALTGWYLSLPLGLALLLGTILAPTDAALAEPVLESKEVPPRVRQALNVESGLNDGLAVPVLLIAIGIIDSEEGGSAAQALGLVLSQLGIGIVGGLVFSWLGARVIGSGAKAGWLNPLHQKIAAVALALACYSSVQLLGGSGFVAVFIAGGLMSHLVRPKYDYLYDFAVAEGHSLVLIAFFIFGAGPATDLLMRGVPWQSVVVAVAALVVLRPISIWVSLLGRGLSRRTVVFLGWFGPRGLATVVFVLVAVDELGALDPLIADTVTVTVLLSIVAHGLSSVPMTRWLTRMHLDEDMPEMGEAYEHPMR